MLSDVDETKFQSDLRGYVCLNGLVSLTFLTVCPQVLVKAGDAVQKGDPLMVMIAMKMEVSPDPPFTSQPKLSPDPLIHPSFLPAHHPSPQSRGH